MIAPPCREAHPASGAAPDSRPGRCLGVRRGKRVIRPPTPPARHALAALALLAALAGGCARPPERPIDGTRPLEGARPASAAGSSVQAGPPPTLAPAASLRTTPTPAPTAAPPLPSPSPVASGPAASPSVYPIISNFQPAPGASLPVGNVVVGARVTTSTDLVDLVVFLNDEPIPQDVSRRSDRVRSVSLVRTLAAGAYEVRIQARDQLGQLGGYRWQFNVGSGTRQVGATPPPRAPNTLPTVGPPSAPPPIRTAAPSPATGR